MANQNQTLSLTHTDTPESRQPIPGLVLIWTPEGPNFIPRAVGDELVIGRGTSAGFDLGDAKISRRHCTVRRQSGAWWIKDEGSHNGTRLDGSAIAGTVRAAQIAVLRAGHCIFLPVEDIREFEGGGIEYNDGMVLGPRLRRAQQEILHRSRDSATMHITGESGVGKENAARLFHRGAADNFIAVNCAAIPAGLAESTLFGTKKNAYPQAIDAIGKIQAADRGTLFLDEIGELSLDIQAKLLRVLEQKEVTPLGTTRPIKVDFRLCSATHKDLGAEVTAGRFREDLYHRLVHPHVCIPPLRRRTDEIPWLLHWKLRERGMTAHSALIEACILRSWPGNVRELLGELRSAASTASEAGRTQVEARDLKPTAGLPFVQDRVEKIEDNGDKSVGGDTSSGGDRGGDDAGSRGKYSKRWLTARANERRLRDALHDARGNVSEVARLLGEDRTTVTRWISVLEIDVSSFS